MNHYRVSEKLSDYKRLQIEIRTETPMGYNRGAAL